MPYSTYQPHKISSLVPETLGQHTFNKRSVDNIYQKRKADEGHRFFLVQLEIVQSLALKMNPGVRPSNSISQKKNHMRASVLPG
mmetsp:Transcript_45594/g.81545  ORF Transcript_45594/g.81545 Transcript_45594/m.81545 type:complete len:84 (+) Transcript_45594:187-438(+)